MTVSSSPRAALRRAAVRATLAPSVHNSQPWQLQVRPDQIRLYADLQRESHILDPRGRQLTISCGCALFNVRTSLAADGIPVRVDRLPDRFAPDLLAVVGLSPIPDLRDGNRGLLDKYLDQRHTNRQAFTAEALPSGVLRELGDLAAEDGVRLVAAVDGGARAVVDEALTRAEQIIELDPAYRIEWRAWREISGEDFGVGVDDHGSVTGWPILLGTDADDQNGWLRVGEALQHVLLELARRGYSAKLCSHVIEVPAARTRLRRELALPCYPQVLLSIGRSAAPSPGSRRRRLLEVISEPDG